MRASRGAQALKVLGVLPKAARDEDFAGRTGRVEQRSLTCKSGSATFYLIGKMSVGSP
jgi:hypothetical protein